MADWNTRLRRHLERAARESITAGMPVCAIALSFDSVDAAGALYGLDGGTMLAAVADRLRALAGPDHIVESIGNKFVLVIAETGAVDGMEIARDLVAQPFAVEVDGKPTALTVAAGVARAVHWSGDATQAAGEVVEGSLKALHSGLRRGHGVLTIYTPEMEWRLRRDAAIERAIGGAARREEFTVAYQPIVEAVSRKVVGVEALARWPNRDLGAIGPGEFVPIAERLGLAADLDRAILRQVVADARTLRARIRDAVIHVNVSAAHLSAGGAANAINTILREGGLGCDAILFEITETVAPDAFDAFVRNVAALRSLGCRIAIDDLGSGFNALSFFARVPVDMVKIDQTLLPTARDERRRAILTGLINVCKNVGVETAVEGIETARQHALVIASGAQYAQGYYYGLPSAA